MYQEDKALFNQKMTAGTKNVFASSNELFGPVNCQSTQVAAARFADQLEGLMNQAPLYTPQMEETLDHSRESVRQFIKTASQLFGSISITLENAY